VDKKGYLKISNDCTLHIVSGGTLYLKNSSSIIIEGNGSIIIEPGGYFCVEEGANIQLLNPNSIIKIFTEAIQGTNPILHIPDAHTVSICDYTYTGSGKIFCE
jgi:hypothetical protein